MFRGAGGPTSSSIGRELMRDRWAGMNWERYFDSPAPAKMRVLSSGVVVLATLMASSRERMGWMTRVGLFMGVVRSGDDLLKSV